MVKERRQLVNKRHGLLCGAEYVAFGVCVVFLVALAAGAESERDLMKVRPVDSVKEFDDVRWKDMSKLDLSKRAGLPETLTFNRATVWPPADRLPPGCDPKAILENAKNPGLGVKDLHKQGITGKGVSVAIIDQPVLPDHPEFVGKFAATYVDSDERRTSSAHGPAVSSLLVGTGCGTAPEARLYFAATAGRPDASYYARGLDWVVEQNGRLPASEKIRVVSISSAPRDKTNSGTWTEAVARAEKAGILVLDCEGFIGPCSFGAADREDVSKCMPGFLGEDRLRAPSPQTVLVPISPRTVAEEYFRGDCSYMYTGRGGLSWGIPYAAGVLAMGWQVSPDLSADQMKELLFKSAYVTKDGWKVINPKELIRLVREAKPS